MQFLDLFSDIGGFRLGLERAGAHPVGWIEWDKFARASYEAMHDTADEFTAKDITEVTADDLEPLRGKVDIIAGGFPCQAFSIAGSRKGFEDTRGTLFFDIIRVAKELKPKAMLLENVKGLINHDKGNTLDTMIKVLNDTGYIVDFEVLNSKNFGVPQNRERVFIVAVRDDLIDAEEWNIEGTTIVPKGKMRIGGYEGTKSFNFNYPKGNNDTPKLKDILENDVNESFYLSDDNLIEITYFNGDTKGKILNPLKDKTSNGWHYEQNIHDSRGITRTVKANGGSGNIPKVIEGLAIKEATKQGYAIAKDGDAVNYQFPKSKTRRGRVGKQIANTLEASAINQGVVEDYRIRKLTPKECFRLQAFPDELFDKAQAVNSNSQLYKQAGNSVTVNVVEEIAKNLLELIG